MHSKHSDNSSVSSVSTNHLYCAGGKTKLNQWDTSLYSWMNVIASYAQGFLKKPDSLSFSRSKPAAFGKIIIDTDFSLTLKIQSVLWEVAREWDSLCDLNTAQVFVCVCVFVFVSAVTKFSPSSLAWWAGAASLLSKARTGGCCLWLTPKLSGWGWNKNIMEKQLKVLEGSLLQSFKILDVCVCVCVCVRACVRVCVCVCVCD